MTKRTAKLIIPSGKVVPNAQINPILGQNAIPVDLFCKTATEKFKHLEEGLKLRLKVSAQERTETSPNAKKGGDLNSSLHLLGLSHRHLLEKSKFTIQNKKEQNAITLEQLYYLSMQLDQEMLLTGTTSENQPATSQIFHALFSYAQQLAKAGHFKILLTPALRNRIEKTT